MMHKVKSLSVLLIVSTFTISCNVSSVSTNKEPSKPSQTSSDTTQKVTQKEKGLNLTYEAKDGKIVNLTSSNILSYKLGSVEKKEFGCSGCPTLDGNTVVYKGKEPITFKLKLNAKQNFTGDGAPSFFTKAEGDDAGAGEAEDASVVVPYNLYRNVDEDFSNNGLIYNIKQKLKSDKKKFSKKAVEDELIFETSGGVLDKDNKLDASKPVITQSSDETNISVFSSDGKVSEFKTASLQSGNTKPDVVREQTPEEKSFLKDTQESIAKIAKDVVKVDEPKVIPSESPKPVDNNSVVASPDPNNPPSNPNATPQQNTIPKNTATVTPVSAVKPVPAKEGCVIKIQPQDSMKAYIQKQLEERNCKIVVDTPSNCVFKVRQKDLPLKPYLQQQIDEQKCDIVIEP